VAASVQILLSLDSQNGRMKASATPRQAMAAGTIT
jgi:hypothetical protein